MFREPLVEVSFNGVISVLALISGMSRLDILFTCRFWPYGLRRVCGVKLGNRRGGGHVRQRLHLNSVTFVGVASQWNEWKIFDHLGMMDVAVWYIHLCSATRICIGCGGCQVLSTQNLMPPILISAGLGSQEPHWFTWFGVGWCPCLGR